MLLAIAALSLTRVSAAQPRAAQASLVVTRSDGAQDCPDAAAIAEQVRAITGADVVTPGLATLASPTLVQVAITHGFGNYAAQINAFGARHGSRSLEDLGPSCASLADAVSVTIAIFLDPYANAPPTSVQHTIAPPPPPTTTTTTTTAPLPISGPPSSEPQPSTRWFTNASAGAAFKLLEHTQPLVFGAVGWRFAARWSLALGGSFVFADSLRSSGGSVDLRLSYGYLEACGRALGASGHPALDWCVAPQVGSLAATGRSYLHTSTEHATWLALGAGPQVLFPFSSAWSWLLTGQFVVPLVRAGFDVQSGGLRSTAFRSPSVSGFVGLGIRGAL